jgi:hypothetical protein
MNSAGIFYCTNNHVLVLLKKNNLYTLPGGRLQHNTSVLEKFEEETGLPLKTLQDNPVSIDRHYRVYFVKAPTMCDTTGFVKGKHAALAWVPYSVDRSKCDFILQRAFHMKGSSLVDDAYFSD